MSNKSPDPYPTYDPYHIPENTKTYINYLEREEYINLINYVHKAPKTHFEKFMIANFGVHIEKHLVP